MTYRQLTLEQRYLIYKLRRIGYSQKEIAHQAGVHPSTVSRELKRNVNRKGYRPKMAHRLALQRKKVPRRKNLLTPRTCARLRQYLKKGWSPDQISGRLRVTDNLQISHQTIYSYIWKNRKEGGTVYTRLRRKGIRYRRKRLHSAPIRNRRPISERPVCVDQKDRIGDWELDTIVSGDRQSAIVSMVERVSNYTLLGWVPQNESLHVGHCMVRMLGPIKTLVHTLTSDNGAEFATHRYVELKLQAMFYIARPYCAHDRGLNEQVNGLVREYFPKGMSFSNTGQSEVPKVMQTLNSRLRKTLNYKNPKEIFFTAVALGF